jgi:hypothetical protein
MSMRLVRVGVVVVLAALTPGCFFCGPRGWHRCGYYAPPESSQERVVDFSPPCDNPPGAEVPSEE